MKQENMASSDKNLRKCRIIFKNLDERENENPKQKVKNILNYLKLTNIHVVNAERKNSKNIAKPGIVINRKIVSSRNLSESLMLP